MNKQNLNYRLDKKIPNRMKIVYPVKANNLKETISNYILHKCNLIKEKFDKNQLTSKDSSKFTFYLTKYKYYPLFEVVINIQYDKDFDLYDINIYIFKNAMSEYLIGYTLEN